MAKPDFCFKCDCYQQTQADANNGEGTCIRYPVWARVQDHHSCFEFRPATEDGDE